MGTDIVSQSRFFIDYSGGNFQLRRVKDAKFKDDRASEVVTSVGVKGGSGVRHKEGGNGFTLSVFRETGEPEVDWDALRETHEPFAFTRQDVDGARKQYRPCYVSKVEDDDDDQGSHMMSVEVVVVGVPKRLS